MVPGFVSDSGQKVHPTDDEGGEDTRFTIKSCLFPEIARKKMLRRIDNWRCMIFIIVLVLGACITIPITPASCSPWFISVVGAQQSESIVDEYGEVVGLTELPNSGECLGYALFDCFCFHVFLLELCARMWSMMDLVEFFANPFSAMDFLVVMLDIIVFFPSVRTGEFDFPSGLTSSSRHALQTQSLAQ
jgi:hypothetical protein